MKKKKIVLPTINKKTRFKSGSYFGSGSREPVRVAGVRLQPQRDGGGGTGSTSCGPCEGGRDGAGMTVVVSCDSCHSAGITLNAGGAMTGAMAVGGGTRGTDPDIPTGIWAWRSSRLTSEVVVSMSWADNDPRSRSILSSSMGMSMGAAGDRDRMESGPWVSWVVSGTSRSQSSIWMRPRNFSSVPANWCTLLSIVSIRWVVRAVSSATWSITLTHSSRAARQRF